MPHRIVQISDDLAALDELDRDLREPRKRKVSIVLPILVTLIVTAGATVIAWYSYNTGVREGSEVAAPILKPQGPAKVTPESPGGLAIPHQDKTVFQAIEGSRSDMRVERLLPPPETPAPLPAQTAEPSQPESSKVRRAERLESGTEERETGAEVEPNKPVRLTPNVGTSSPPPSISRKPTSAVPKKRDAGTATMAMPAPAKPAAMPKPGPAAEKPAVARAMPAPKPRIRPKFGYGVQIASLTSKTKAGDFWDRQVAANKDLLGDLSLFVHTVTVKGRTFHRVQGGTFESRAAASDLCAALKKRGVGCVIVHFGK